MLKKQISSWKSWLGTVLLLLSGVVSAEAFDHGPLLWKVQKTGYPDSYVFGTVHADRAKVLAIGNKLTPTLESCDRFYGEINLGMQEMQATQMALFLKPDQRLEDIVGKALAQKTRQRFDQHGLGGVLADRLKPWAAAVSLMYPKPTLGVPLDLFLQNIARQKGLPVGGLETVNEQLSLFEGMDDAMQISMLERVVDRYEDNLTDVETLISAYIDQDLGKVLRLSQQQMQQESPQVRQWTQEELLDKRNARFVLRMVPLMKNDALCVAIGALHLPGDTGVLALLQAKGFTLAPQRLL